MTAGDDSLFVTVGGRDIGLEALLKKVDAEMAVSADRAVKLGQSYARLAQAQGQPTTAANILAGTMQRAGSASEQSLIGISTQAARLTNSSQGLRTSIAGLGGQLSQLGGTAGSLAGSIGNLAGSFGTLGGIGAAIGLGKIAVDLSVAGANADLVRQRFDGLAESAGTTGEALLNALRAASGGEINDLNLTLAANKAQLLGVADSAEEFSVLMGIARDRAQQMGISTTQAFNDLTTGLGRGSALILDNLGIIVSVKEANDAYAKSLGTTADKLTEAQQKQALINQVLAQGRASLEATGGAVQSQAGIYAQFSANVANATSGLGSFLSGGLAPLAAQFNQTAAATGQFVTFLQGIPGALFPTAEAAAASATALAAFDAEMQRSGDTAQAEAAYQAALAAALAQSAGAATVATGAFDAERSALGQAQIATQAHTAELQANAQAAVLAAAEQDAQKAATDQMTAAANQAVSSFLALNPTIDAAGIASAVAAGKIPALIGQLANLRIEAYSARDAIAALAAEQGLQVKSNIGPGGVGVGAVGITSGRNNSVDAVLELQKANKKAADDQAKAAADSLAGDLEIAKAKGDTAKVIALLRQQQQGLNKDSLEYKRIEASIIDASKPKRGRGGGGGGTRLTDQQKLQNSLLTSQEDYQAKSEAAAAQYAEDTQKIYQDFYEKLRTAQRDFDQSQLEGRAGFYDNLGQIENQQIAQQASAAYETASIEAGKIAQEKGADVAEKYMDAQEQIISARARRLSEIEKAEKDKDTGRAEYLKGVDEQYKKAEDAKLARIKEGEGSLASERDKQLADAAQKEQDAQDKIGLSADRAAERKITASERAGKAIDAELLKVGALGTAYDQLGASGARAGITPATPATTTPAATVPGAAPAAAATDPVVAALNAAQAAIVAALGSIKGAADNTTSAVRSLSGKFVS